MCAGMSSRIWRVAKNIGILYVNERNTKDRLLVYSITANSQHCAWWCLFLEVFSDKCFYFKSWKR